MRNLILFILASIVSMLPAGCGDEAPPRPNEADDSPEVVYQTMHDAIQADDWEAASGCMDEESQDLLAWSLAFGITFLSETDAEQSTASKVLFEEYGFDLHNGGNSSEVANKPAFIAELLTFAKANTPDDDFDNLANLGAGRLAELKIDGNQANGIIEIEGHDNLPIEFRKVDGHWLVHLPKDKLPM